MRIGTSLTEPQSPQALDVLRDELLMAVDDGFSSAWMANIFGLDALTALAVAGRGSPASRSAPRSFRPTPGIRPCSRSTR